MFGYNTSVKRKQNHLPLIIMSVGGLLLAVAAIWLITDGFAGPTASVDQPATVDEVQRVSLKDAYAAYLTGNAVFLDVRGAESYNAARIPGALNIPLAELASRLDELSKTDWILTYCT